MDPFHPLRRHRRRPLYQINRADPSTYLSTARLHLLRALPQTHRLHSRTAPTGNLKLAGHPPNIPRVPFTDAELAEIRTKRRYTADPDDVRYQLQDSKLVQMWNADYGNEEQWREYDVARPVMEVKRDVAGLPGEMFHSDEVVGEKRGRRSISEMYPGKMVVDRSVVQPVELEDGEIMDEAGYAGDTDEMQEDEDEAEEEVLQDLREQNKTLRTANDMMRILAKAFDGDEDDEEAEMSPPTPSTARSEHSDSSEDGSGDSDMAMCDFDMDDIDGIDFDENDDEEDKDENDDDDDRDNKDDDSAIIPPVYINSWLDEVDPGSQESKPILAMQDESKETRSGHELG